METKISGGSKEIIISYQMPTIIIGERINPTGRKRLADIMKAGNYEIILEEARLQVKQGAEIIDVNVGISGVDEPFLLTEIVRKIMEEMEVPLCIDSTNPKALESALKVYKGKPLINSVNGEEKSLNSILPIVKEYGAAVIAMPVDEKGIPGESPKRLEISEKIVEKAVSLGIPKEDVIVDCLALTVATDNKAGLTAIETAHGIRTKLGLNVTVGASNISFGMPDRALINTGFLSLAISAGVTCPILDPATTRPTVLVTDLILGRDNYASRYIKDYRKRIKSAGLS